MRATETGAMPAAQRFGGAANQGPPSLGLLGLTSRPATVPPSVEQPSSSWNDSAWREGSRASPATPGGRQAVA
jgi:hypothetical protein